MKFPKLTSKQVLPLAAFTFFILVGSFMWLFVINHPDIPPAKITNLDQKIDLGVHVEMANANVLVQRYAVEGERPYTGFCISIHHPRRPPLKGDDTVDVAVTFVIEPPQPRHPTQWIKRLRIGAVLGPDDFDRGISFARFSETGQDTMQLSYGPPQPNNRHENREIMDTAEKLAKEAKGPQVSARLVYEFIRDGRITTKYWRHDAQARREYAYRDANPSYVPVFIKADLVELNDARRATTVKVAPNDPLLKADDVMFGTTIGDDRLCIESSASRDGEGYWDRTITPNGPTRIRLAYELEGKVYMTYFEFDMKGEVRELSARSEGGKVFLTVNSANEYRPWLIREIPHHEDGIHTAASDDICDNQKRPK